MIDYMKADAKKQGLKNYAPRLVKADEPELTPHSADLVFFCDTLHHLDERVAYLRKLAPAQATVSAPSPQPTSRTLRPFNAPAKRGTTCCSRVRRGCYCGCRFSRLKKNIVPALVIMIGPVSR